MRLVVVTDNSNRRFSHLQLAELAIKGGADSIQLREKRMKSQQLLALATEMSRLCQKHNVRFIVNDRADIALLSGADGVHLGQNDLPIQAARKILGPNKLIGGTASSLEEALALEHDGADYIGYGHIFETTTKIKTGLPKGAGELKRIVDVLKIPVVAIGGIHLGNIKSVIEAKPGGIAVCGAVCSADNPEIATRALKEIVNSAGKRPVLASKF